MEGNGRAFVSHEGHEKPRIRIYEGESLRHQATAVDTLIFQRIGVTPCRFQFFWILVSCFRKSMARESQNRSIRTLVRVTDWSVTYNDPTVRDIVDKSNDLFVKYGNPKIAPMLDQ